MIVAIVGSRNYPDFEEVREYVRKLPKDTIVISGGAKGVDTVAIDEAILQDLQIQIFPALWKEYGKIAGFKRNSELVNAADKVVAFHYQSSPGTKDTIKKTITAGKPLDVFEPCDRMGSTGVD